MGNVKMMKEDMRMLFENVDRFEEIPEVYGVFPLKEDYLEAGNKALEQYGVQAEVEDNDEFDEYYEPRNEEYEKGYDLIEAFLNRAVDAA